MEERLSQSWKVLVEAKSLSTKCPGWWATAQKVALGQGWDHARYEELFQDAIRFEPTYIMYLYRKALYLQPRWFGEEGEFGEFLESVANNIGGEEGNILYARIIWNLEFMRFDKEFLQAPGVSWLRAKQGFGALINKYPDSLSIKSEYCLLSRLARDRGQMKELFAQIGGRMDMRVWRENKGRFIEDRKWAYQN